MSRRKIIMPTDGSYDCDATSQLIHPRCSEYNDILVMAAYYIKGPPNPSIFSDGGDAAWSVVNLETLRMKDDGPSPALVQ